MRHAGLDPASRNRLKKQDSGIRRNDGKVAFGTFYEFIKD